MTNKPTHPLHDDMPALNSAEIRFTLSHLLEIAKKLNEMFDLIHEQVRDLDARLKKMELDRINRQLIEMVDKAMIQAAMGRVEPEPQEPDKPEDK